MSVDAAEDDKEKEEEVEMYVGDNVRLITVVSDIKANIEKLGRSVGAVVHQSQLRQYLKRAPPSPPTPQQSRSKPKIPGSGPVLGLFGARIRTRLAPQCWLHHKSAP